MEIEDALAMIAEEAHQQGFLARQLDSGMWQFRINDTNVFAEPKTVHGLLQVLRVLIRAGLEWSIPD